MASRVVVTTEQHLWRRGETIWVVGDEDNGFFQRYRAVFDQVTVLARVGSHPPADATPKRVCGHGVKVAALPSVHGWRGFAAGSPKFFSVLSRTLSDDATYLLRAPGGVASLAWLWLKARGLSYGAEIVADPCTPGPQQSGMVDRIGKQGLAAALRGIARGAGAVSYVTETTLQQRYPPGPNASVHHYSSLDIGSEAFSHADATLARIQAQPDRLSTVKLVFVGRLKRAYKGLDVLLKALAVLERHQLRASLTVLGGGDLLESYQKQARALCPASEVRFLGETSDRSRLFQELAASDVFVLPSRREGLPRALIEAMAVGLPAVATDVGGVAELLDRREMVDVDDAEGLAEAILRLCSARALRSEASVRNAKRARAYDRKELQARRTKFYRELLSQRDARPHRPTRPDRGPRSIFGS